MARGPPDVRAPDVVYLASDATALYLKPLIFVIEGISICVQVRRRFAGGIPLLFGLRRHGRRLHPARG